MCATCSGLAGEFTEQCSPFIARKPSESTEVARICVIAIHRGSGVEQRFTGCPLDKDT